MCSGCHSIEVLPLVRKTQEGSSLRYTPALADCSLVKDGNKSVSHMEGYSFIRGEFAVTVANMGKKVNWVRVPDSIQIPRKADTIALKSIHLFPNLRKRTHERTETEYHNTR